MSSARKTAKDRMLAIIRDQPDGDPYDDILRKLAFHRMVDRGLADVDKEELSTTLQLRLRVKAW